MKFIASSTLLIVLFSIGIAVGQGTRDSVITTVFYFGGTDCAFCIAERNVQNIKKMKEQLPTVHKDRKFKFVLVVMDLDIKQGIAYSQKYPSWDELSIGEFYNNELMLEHVNKTQLPGVPHIMIYQDSLLMGKYNVPTIRKRTLLLDLVGARAIEEWIQNGYRFDK